MRIKQSLTSEPLIFASQLIVQSFIISLHLQQTICISNVFVFDSFTIGNDNHFILHVNKVRMNLDIYSIYMYIYTHVANTLYEV